MSIHTNLSKILQATATLFVGFAILSSGFFIHVANAANNSDLNNAEIEEVKNIMKEGNLESRKSMVKDKASKTKNKKMKEVLENQIVVEEKLITSKSDDFSNKFENSLKKYGCENFTSSIYGLNNFGNSVWKFSLTTYACNTWSYIAGGKVQSSWGETYAPFWAYAGPGWNNWEQSTSTEYVAVRQGAFNFCFGGWGIGCIQQSAPSLKNHMRPANSYHYGEKV